jgi:hypothetical protein
LNDSTPSSGSGLDTLPLADSNLGVFLALHTIVSHGKLPPASSVRSKDPVFRAVRKDIESLLRHRPDQMADTGVLDQQRNQQVSKLTCTLAMFSCKTDQSAERQYADRLVQALLADRGQHIRTRPDEQLELGTDFYPDFLNLYLAAKVKFTDRSVCGLFQALLGNSRIPLRTDPELLRLMTIVCDRCSAKEASQLLNGLLRAHDANPAAFARLSAQQTIPTIIGKFSNDDVVQVIRVTTIFIIRTSLRDQADELLQELVERLDSEHLKLATTRLANIMMCVRKVHPELISSLLSALASPRGSNSFFKLLGVLRASSATAKAAISYDAQGIAAALYDEGLEAKILAHFLQRIRGLDLSGVMYEQLTQEIGVLRRLLENGSDRPLAQHAPSADRKRPAERLLPLLQLGLARYEGQQLDYFVKAINVLSSDDFRRADLDLIIGHATADLPGSLDHLAVPEDFVADQTSRELGSALVTLWIQIELADESKERQPSAADLSRKLRIVVDGQLDEGTTGG